MKIVGLDMSFTRTGIAYINDEEKIIECTRAHCPIGDKTFHNVFKAALDLSNEIVRSINKLGVDIVVAEEPIANASFSGGLFALDCMVLGGIISYSDVMEVWTTHPSYLGHLHGERSYSKSKSVKLAEAIFEIFKDNGYKVSSKKICHDEAEAFLIALRGYMRYSKDEGVINSLGVLNLKLINNKERILYRREKIK